MSAIKITSLFFSLILTCCETSHIAYKKGGDPIDIQPECVISTLSNNPEYKINEMKEGNIIFSYGAFSYNVIFSENNLVVSSESNTSNPTLPAQVDSIFRNLATTCKRDSSTRIIYN